MGAPLVVQNARPPQWFLEVKESFVASRNRAQEEVRKTTIIDRISHGLTITGLASMVAGIAVATFAAVVVIPCLLLGLTILPLVITCGGVGATVLGIGLAVLGICIRKSKIREDYFQRTLNRAAEADAIQHDIRFLNQFENNENLLRSVDNYKNSPVRYSIDLYYYQYYSEQLNENTAEIKALRRELSQQIGDISWIPKTMRVFHIDENVREDHLNQIEEVDRREECRQLLNRLERAEHAAEFNRYLRDQANARFMQYVPPGGWPQIPEGVQSVYRLRRQSL